MNLSAPAGIRDSYASASPFGGSCCFISCSEDVSHPGLTFLVPRSENSLLHGSSRNESVSKSLVVISTQAPFSLQLAECHWVASDPVFINMQGWWSANPETCLNTCPCACRGPWLLFSLLLFFTSTAFSPSSIGEHMIKGVSGSCIPQQATWKLSTNFSCTFKL